MDLTVAVGCKGFNPRTREGATLFPFVISEMTTVSIHAPVRVRLMAPSVSFCKRTCFNPRTRVGATGLRRRIQ